MELAGTPNDLLTELKKYQRTCSADGQFASKAEFHEWADVVDTLLTSAPDVQKQFRYKIESVDIAYRFGTPVADSENEAIRVLSRHILSIDLKPMFGDVSPEKKAEDHPGLTKQQHPPAPVTAALPWFQRPLGVVILTVVAGLIVALLAKRYI